MNYPESPLAQMTVALCKAYGIKNIIISPGSRNAPLTIGFTNDPFFNCFSIVDERCAAFFGLGIAQQSKSPTALVCTSGSALLNYFPAIAEAFYTNIPMVVLSADRPKHLVEIGDGQTINQVDVYGSHVRYSTNLKSDLKNSDSLLSKDAPPLIKNLENKFEKFLGLIDSIEKQNEAEIRKALSTSILQSSPVHINVPFDEPLYNMVENSKFNYSNSIPQLEHSLPENLDSIQEKWSSFSKIMILVGAMDPGMINQELLEKIISDPRIVVFTETLSNLHHPNLFPFIDKLITSLSDSEFEKLRPELLLTLGGMIVSKRIKAFLRKYKPKEHWHVGENKANDTFFSLNKHFKSLPQTFLSQMDYSTESSDYRDYWLQVKNYRSARHKEFLDSAPYSDLKVFSIILKRFPENVVLHLGNSATVRYSQLFNLADDIEVYCNRGTSGIDGSTSTAIGAAVANNKQNIIITGDLSFFYDSNALWNNYIPNNFRIIILNNSGGGIFRILPGPKKVEAFEEFFETHHSLTAKELSDMYSFEYSSVNNLDDLDLALETFYNESVKPKILEVFTPRLENDKTLTEYFKFLG
ncbi:2-succinyl-5-enolpyruvyl-6-hydroxy-3-cyclohexene-1-carboxylate synthase [Aegicerativicinus sediminis]|uniref:2-succinyl-5-enolpyruvyl-6-hydroxy-3- cyclohexene-1-carboxylate synthase n=1 Tax=Aegicerativicinus sediminis TaxID=2893202 RepID=UPI001E48CF7D|nr:2-succinyl-5-enolpyruvyl-6-hydroxy-3-cyclohexene-1-carboxylate synthase [Aegicerativicinus sediminis]